MSRTKIYPNAQAVIERLRTRDRRNPPLNREAVGLALNAHLATLNLPLRPVRWLPNLREGSQYMWSAAESAAESAAWSAAWSAARSAARSAAESAARSAAWSAAWSAAILNAYNEVPDTATKRLLDIFTPLQEAFELGLYIYWITDTECVCVPQPELHIMNGALHCENGPSVHWPGESYWFWHGYQVPDWVIEEKEKITHQAIATERNAELRRVMLEIYGFGRWMSEAGATLVSEDISHGRPRKLYEATLAGKPIRIIHVVNGSLEDDGSRREFFLGAPNDARTPHEVIAASYGFNPSIYYEFART